MPPLAERTPTSDAYSKEFGGSETSSCDGRSCPTPTGTIVSSLLLPGLPLTSNVTAPLTRQECMGFPTGNFRIRAAGTGRYWTLHNGEIEGDGNAVCLWHCGNDSDDPAQVFFVNPRGELCCSGLHLDVMGSTLIVAHNRLPTHPWPNPWSHPLPTFSYSQETKMISVKFYSDPLISYQWPRSDNEWTDREFVLATRPSVTVEIYRFNDIARWAPSSRFIRWTERTGEQWDVGCWNGLAVEERVGLEDTERAKWELEAI